MQEVKEYCKEMNVSFHDENTDCVHRTEKP